MPKLEKQDVLWQIDKLVNDQWHYRDMRSSIKKWCVTVWLATVVAISTDDLALPLYGAGALLFVPLLSFWTLEGIYGAIDRLQAKHISDLEERLAREDFEYDVPSDVLFVSRNQSSTLREKAKLFVLAFFFSETVSAIYILLIVASTLFLWYFSSVGMLG